MNTTSDLIRRRVKELILELRLEYGYSYPILSESLECLDTSALWRLYSDLQILIASNRKIE